MIVSPRGMARVLPLFGSHDIRASVVEAKKSFEVGIAFGHDLTCLFVPTSQIRTDPSQLDETFDDAEISITFNKYTMVFFTRNSPLGSKATDRMGAVCPVIWESL